MIDNKSSPYVCVRQYNSDRTSVISVPFLITAQYYRPLESLLHWTAVTKLWTPFPYF